MTKPTSTADLSPLDQIRQTEAEVNRSIAAARQSSEQVIAAAEQQGLELKRQAREAGIREGELRHRAMISSAEVEFNVIVAQAQTRSQELDRTGRLRMDKAVQRAIEFVLGIAVEGANA